MPPNIAWCLIPASLYLAISFLINNYLHFLFDEDISVLKDIQEIILALKSSEYIGDVSLSLLPSAVILFTQEKSVDNLIFFICCWQLI